MSNLPAQISTLSREIGVLTEKLAPAGSDAIARYLLSMRKAGMAIPAGMKPDDLEPTYGYALADVPAYGLHRAVEKLLKGEYEIERGFIPRPPELAAMARSEAKVIRDDLARLRGRERTLKELSEKPHEADEASKARVKALLANFRKSHADAKAKERGHPVHVPMSPEQAEYWSKISALPDAETISAENHEQRRKIGNELAELASAANPDRGAA